MPTWKKYDDARPYSTVGGFAIDAHGCFPIMHRSNAVRSVRNCWSLPTGNCEIGVDMVDQFKIELKEELNIDAAPYAEAIGWYDNISKETDNWWHWIVHVVAVPVVSLEHIVNREPLKHDQIICIDLDGLYRMIDDHQVFAPHHAEFFVANRQRITQVYQDFLKR